MDKQIKVTLLFFVIGLAVAYTLNYFTGCFDGGSLKPHEVVILLTVGFFAGYGIARRDKNR